MQKAYPSRQQKDEWLLKVVWGNPWYEYERLKRSLSQNPDKYQTEAMQLARSLGL
jgi:hypothetical protein